MSLAGASGARIEAIVMENGDRYAGKMFIDATYEGDLMAAAKVDYHVGREATSTYNEKWNGVQTGVLHHKHHFGAVKEKISPYVVPGDPASGVLPRISTAPPGEYGQGDKRIQAYCYRLCLTDHEPNRVPFPKPDGYDPKQYELLNILSQCQLMVCLLHEWTSKPWAQALYKKTRPSMVIPLGE